MPQHQLDSITKQQDRYLAKGKMAPQISSGSVLWAHSMSCSPHIVFRAVSLWDRPCPSLAFISRV